MHSRVFCIIRKDSEEDKEYLENMTSYDIYEEMNNIADYTDDSDLESDIKWLASYCSTLFTIKDRTLKINRENVEKYILNKAEDVKKITQTINTVKDYLTAKNKLRNILSKYGGFYFYEPNILSSLDDFVEFLWGYETEDLEFEIVKTFDYHY